MTKTTTLAERAQEAVEHRDNPAQKTAGDLVRSMQHQFAAGLPRHVPVDRWMRVALTALRKTPQLQDCTAPSLLAGLMQSAQLGLEVNDARGQSWLIPRKNNRAGTIEATWQLGYMGLVDLAGRGGITCEAREVHANDRFEYSYGLARDLVHKPAAGERGPVVAYYAIAWDRDGRCLGFEVASHAEMVEFRDQFAGAKGAPAAVRERSPWWQHFDAMARKTVLKRCLKYLPLPVEVAAPIAADDREVIDIDDVGLVEIPAPVRDAEPDTEPEAEE